MNPAWSVILLTTLIGVGQGLFIALYGAELAGFAGRGGRGWGFFAIGGGAVLMITGAGLVASFFHLGRPERFWRTATMWRTSWLSREVIVLPLFMAGTLLWTLGHHSGPWPTREVGAATAAAALLLYLCTAMIYISVRFIQEWAHALTLANFTLIGLASGATLAAALASWRGPGLAFIFARAAVVLTVLALAVRVWSLARNARLVPRSTLQTAIGVRHPQIRQLAMGFMGGSFNTREFFHGRAPGTLRLVKAAFLVLGFILPALLMLVVALREPRFVVAQGLLAAALVLQFAGLLAERWFFFAQANHPQNLYYQAIS